MTEMHIYSETHKNDQEKQNKTETRVDLLASDSALGMASTLLVTAKLYNLLKHL